MFKWYKKEEEEIVVKTGVNSIPEVKLEPMDDETKYLFQIYKGTLELALENIERVSISVNGIIHMKLILPDNEFEIDRSMASSLMLFIDGQKYAQIDKPRFCCIEGYYEAFDELLLLFDEVIGARKEIDLRETLELIASLKKGNTND